MYKRILLFLMAFVMVFAMCSCNIEDVDDKEDEVERLLLFENGGSADFWARNDNGNGYPFNCKFQSDNAVIHNGLLTLYLTHTDNSFIGAEYRSSNYFSYGTYSVKMKPAKCSGVISSFFTYTGNPWDEIDIEFLGNDTTCVQFNYFTSGEGEHAYIYQLGFDAAEDFHEYAFEWLPDCITWYVDGVAVYSVTENIPVTDSQIMMNIWNVHNDLEGWAGRFDSTHLPATAQYEWIDYKSMDN